MLSPPFRERRHARLIRASRSEALQYNKTAAARVRAAAECIEAALTSLTALLDNSLIDSPLLATRGGSSQAERSLSEFVGLSFVCFGTLPVILNFGFECQYFLAFFGSEPL